MVSFYHNLFILAMLSRNLITAWSQVRALDRRPVGPDQQNSAFRGRHCEERSDEAISTVDSNCTLDCFALLAMTNQSAEFSTLGNFSA